MTPAVFWRMLRPHTLSAAIVPVAVGSACAFKMTGQLRQAPLLVMLAACLLIQIATNFFNEYYDYLRGLDNEHSVGIGGAIVRDGVKPRAIMSCALAFYGIAAILGLWLAWGSSWLLLPIGAFCMLCGYLYTGGPCPISATPFGELVAGLLLGSLVICLTFYIQTHTLVWSVFLLSLPVALLIGAILTANNIRDRVGDMKGGRHTLVILLGHRRSLIFLASLFVLACLWPLFLALRPGFGPWFLLPLIALPYALQALRIFAPRENAPPLEMLPAMRATARTNTVFGLCYALSFLGATFTF